MRALVNQKKAQQYVQSISQSEVYASQFHRYSLDTDEFNGLFVGDCAVNNSSLNFRDMSFAENIDKWSNLKLFVRMLKNIREALPKTSLKTSFTVDLIAFLRYGMFLMSKSNITSRFKDIENRNPILA